MEIIPKSKMLHQRKEEFSAAVRKSGGKVLVLVHPAYLLDPFYNVTQKDEAFKKFQVRVLETAKKSNIPVVVLYNIGKGAKTLEQFAGQNPYFVETYHERAEPTMDWTNFNDLLRQSGVTGIFLGGSVSKLSKTMAIGNKYVRFDRRLYDKIKAYERKGAPKTIKTITGNCVGQAYINFIENNFEKVRLAPGLLYHDRPVFRKKRVK